ncbi:hypothetical protein BKA66DRAFT_479207 [Pyrenochaeta sp. MPI-SDFR-AT-0127]|nr:hypothetical protein BKA66DRAFT_479207 [Pyrenochaeta sp. MPI-SDFR-AT-0127]
MENIKHDVNHLERSDGISSITQSQMLGRPRNIDDNEETPLLRPNTDGAERSSQHDNRSIAKFFHWISASTYYGLLSIWRFFTSTNKIALSLIRRNHRLFGHMAFILIFVGAGVPLCISLARNQFPLGLLVIESAIMIGWAIFSRLAEEEHSFSNSRPSV